MKTAWHILGCLALLLGSCRAIAQDKDLLVYLDTLEQVSDADHYDHIRILKGYYENRRDCAVLEFYRSGQRKMTGFLSDKYNIVKDGPFTTFYENGNRQSQIEFKRDSPSGNCYFWYENGNKKIEAEFVTQRKSDPLLKIHNYWSRIAIQRVVDGKGHFEDEDEDSFSEGELLDGFKEGQWWGTDYSDNFKFTEQYHRGKLVEGRSTDSVGNQFTYRKAFIDADPPGGRKAFFSHFHKQMAAHDRAFDVSHFKYATVSMTIKRDGSLENVAVLDEMEAELKQQIVDAVLSFGRWNPAAARGILTEVSILLPVPVSP